ncbi:D(4) dopamine receptor, partial [Marmota marmota marmota]|uniref:D(4) dopamine receptor n=1 Tax=Marmota marmota marmota TaxID=9994 RepID=UPI00076228A6
LGAAGAAALVGGVLLIGVVLAGNSLVCVSVASERSLQTPTNYFIVSLAAADLLLALLVLPLFVYSEVSLRPRLLLRPVPVPAEPLSTQVASLIRNIEWQQTVAGAPDLLAPWSSAVLGPLESLLLLLSVPLCLSSPLPLSTCLGFCHTEAPVFGAGDSRNWRLGQTPPSPQPDSPPLHSEEPAGQTTRWGLSPAQYPQGARTHRCLRPSTPHRRPPRALVNKAWGPPGAVSWTGQRIQGEAGGRGRAARWRRGEWERVGRAFLVCWTPFFVVHITGALCRACFVPPRLVSAVTWLGYVNSALNPLIYTVFNTEFRSVFRKALRPSCRAPGPCCASD